MEEFFRDFHFLRPWYLLLLFLPLLFYWKFFRGVRNKSSWEAVCDKRLLDFLLVRGSSAQRRAVSYLAFAGFVGAVLALSGPVWQKKEVPDLAPENPVMLLLNMSTDMAAKDLTPNRLTRAKFEISDLLKLLRNVQAGLIVYTREPFLITPITEDLPMATGWTEPLRWRSKNFRMRSTLPAALSFSLPTSANVLIWRWKRPKRPKRRVSCLMWLPYRRRFPKS